VEIRRFSSLRITLRFSLRAPLIELFEIIGLGSSLGVGDGRTGAAVLINSLSAVPLRYLQPLWVLTSEPLRQAATQSSTHSCVELGALELQPPSMPSSAGPLQREC
jgi:hypothetical protein